MPDTLIEIERLSKMKKGELRVAWASEFGEDAPQAWTVAEILSNYETRRALRNAAPQAEEVEGEVVDEDDPIVPEEVADEVGQALALREKQPEPTMALMSPQEWNAVLTMSEHFARTTFVPESYRGRPADVAAAFAFGREIGLGPMTAMRDIHMIDGRPSIAAHRQLALLRKGGVRILESEATKERAYIKAQRADTGEIMAVEFTMEEAAAIRRKGKALVDGDNWRNYPSDMLWARAVGRLTRRLGSDLLNGLPPYVAEEVADFSGWGVEYNGAGEMQARSAVPREVRRDNDPSIPKTWAAVNAIADFYGPEIGWVEWVKDACEALYKTRESASLTNEQRSTLLQKASGAIVALREAHDPNEFPPPNRETIAKAWASVMGGTVLAGPMWRLSPDEEAVPTYNEFHGIPEADDIPFGDPAEADTAFAEHDREQTKDRV